MPRTETKKRVHVLDTFCGAGGSSTGAVLAIEELGWEPRLTCVNHNKRAIETHTVNHPWARHYCTGVDDLNLNSMYGDTLLDVLWSSPSCFVAGTLILTKRGQVPIEKIRVGDEVLTHRGRWKRVTHTFPRRLAKTCTLRSADHPGLRTTPDHPFYTRYWQWPRKGMGRIPKLTTQWRPARTIGTKKWRWATPFRIEPLPLPKPPPGSPLDPTLLRNLGAYLDGKWLPSGNLKKWVEAHFGKPGALKIPSWMLTAPEALKSALLEGCATPQAPKRVGISSNNKSLITSLRILQTTRGWAVEAKNTPAGTVSLRWAKDRLSHRGWGTKTNRFSQVTSYRETGRGEWVYNFEVEDDHSYIADGIVVHNCVTHSTARGGAPINEQDRATAWCVVRIAETLRPPIILIENVTAFMRWGPCSRKWSTKNKRWEIHPDRKREGETFQAWINALKSIGYKVEWKTICCADYGDPTTRERLFIQCVSGHRKIVWPNATHCDPEQLKKAREELFSQSETRLPWVPARKVIDWSLEGTSIFERKRTLVEKTLRRIFIGLDRIGLKNFADPAAPEEFLVRQMGQSTAESLNGPLSAIVGGPKHYLGKPFLAKLRGTNTTARLETPAPAITAGGNHLGLVQVNLDALPQQSDGVLREVNNPTPTVATAGAISLIRAKATKLKNKCKDNFLIQVAHGNGKTEPDGDSRRVKPLGEPLGAITGSNEFGVAEPILVQLNHTDQNPETRSRIRGMDETLPTICGNRGEWSICEAHLIPNFGEKDGQIPRTHRLHNPLPTVTGHGAGALIQAKVRPAEGATKRGRGTKVDPRLRKLVEKVLAQIKPTHFSYHGEWHESGRPIIIIQNERYVLEILFRMLQPHELSAAQGFPAGYQFKGTKTEIIKQIGNAVPCNTARALVKAALTQNPEVGAPTTEWTELESSLSYALIAAHGMVA